MDAASEARTLATRLADLDDSRLAELFALRQVNPTVTWADHFDAAEALLETASLSRALQALPAPVVDALDAAIDSDGPVTEGRAREILDAAALLDPHGAPFAAVATARASATRAAEAPASAGEPASAAAEAERAFTAIASLADVLHTATATPLARIGTGTLGAAERRALIAGGAVADAAAAEEMVAIGEAAGLLVGHERRWLVTAAGREWLHLGTGARWSRVAARLRERLPLGVHRDLDPTAGWTPATEWAAAYPLDSSWPAKAAHLRRLLQRWAVIDAAGIPADWVADFAAGGEVDVAALAAHLPPEVDRVFLQNDLTAIAPGPLAVELDERLRQMAHRESRAQATGYRFTAESLAAALTAGETAESLREFLTGLSLTGLPQPLAYEIDRAAQRHGTLRVGPDWTARTRITSHDGALLQTVAVDQTLRPLGLTVDGDDLIARTSVDTAFWMLSDARYPVVAVDADGNPRRVDRHRVAEDLAPVPSAAERYAEVVGRLRAIHGQDADIAWLGRELEHAVRTRAVVHVEVKLPDGSARTFLIEATGLAAGRLRGRDHAADVERTLPVSHIVRVTPA